TAEGYTDKAKAAAISHSDDNLAAAKGYADTVKGEAIKEANIYTDNSASQAVSSANSYTDRRSTQAENNAVARSNDYTNQRFSALKQQVDRNEKRANGGIAGAMAMSAIPSVPGHDFSFGMAASGYRDQGAIAAGVKANVTPNTSVSLNTAWDSGNGVGVAAGVAVGW
ncbi:YadA-like family protein, partial [Salmonella enterica]|nr:YadA-like family protein [Salmonella enterica]